MMMKTLSCEWCGQHSNDEYPVWGHKETVNSPYAVSHQTPNYCIMAALSRADLSRAVLSRAVLSGANLREANLNWADLSEADLSGANLSGAVGPFAVGAFGRHTAIAAGGYIVIGCERHDYDWWLANYEACGQRNGYTPEEIADYGAWIQLAVARQRRIELATPPAA